MDKFIEKFEGVQKWPTYPYFGQNNNFSWKKGPSLVNVSCILTSCKKSEKINEPILRKIHCSQADGWAYGRTDRQIDEQTDKSEFIGLSSSARGAKITN